MKQFIYITLFSFGLSQISFGQTPEELEAELKAQQEINSLLKDRIEALEAELEGRKLQPPQDRTLSPAVSVALDDPEMDRALERALQRNGAAVLAPYVFEITPTLSWSHTGRDALQNKETIYGASIDTRLGLPGGFMIGATLPYFDRNIDDRGSNNGIGDTSFTLWKSFISGSNNPSVVGSVRYSIPSGDDFREAGIPLGSGFHKISGRLSAVKRIAPLAFYGNVSYTHHFENTVNDIAAKRSGIFGIGGGVNLAATPEITLSTGLSFTFENELEIDSIKIDNSKSTVGIVSLGTGIILNRNVFLSLSAGFGITDDAPDVIVSASLPIRF
ncbi:transporter [Pseudemcibacter aquimaris]|uniref:transporter n=1 Tax=Pseudemcibacter aquimaris TaxID=2857064 RepID=UPI002010E1D9|nr:transporter [Pseudemcibacter aquimaris]MCC3859980.1 transporter [Pseudemcibacter aquimaris]WDU57312.1 transporter [Pseudemcibacter aquimaris]